MESFTNFIRSMLPWFATPISRIVLLERTIYRPLWIDLVSRDISVDPKQIRNLGKRCLSFDLRSRLITQTIIHTCDSKFSVSFLLCRWKEYRVYISTKYQRYDLYRNERKCYEFFCIKEISFLQQFEEKFN